MHDLAPRPAPECNGEGGSEPECFLHAAASGYLFLAEDASALAVPPCHRASRRNAIPGAKVGSSALGHAPHNAPPAFRRPNLQVAESSVKHNNDQSSPIPGCLTFTMKKASKAEKDLLPMALRLIFRLFFLVFLWILFSCWCLPASSSASEATEAPVSASEARPCPVQAAPLWSPTDS